MPKNILITGGAGFIGSHVVDELLKYSDSHVFVLDNFDEYYDPQVKRANVLDHLFNPRFTLVEGDIRDVNLVEKFKHVAIDGIVHIAAKAGVRPSILNPGEYMDVNVNGTQNMLEFAKQKNVKQFVFASSSSVYGVNPNTPWSEADKVLMPISPYASSKVSCELLGHVYSHLYGIRFLALRFFTVFGPRQRPDLAIHKFSKMILEGQRIPMYGDGSTRRDYTYVADIVSGIVGALQYDKSLFEVINLGNRQTISLSEMIATLERAYQTKALIEHLPEQPGDVPITFADVSKARELLGYAPAMPFEEGIHQFKEWFLQTPVLANV